MTYRTAGTRPEWTQTSTHKRNICDVWSAEVEHSGVANAHYDAKGNLLGIVEIHNRFPDGFKHFYGRERVIYMLGRAFVKRVEDAIEGAS
ncbi:hypothetical protein NBRC116590_03050 [Pelagimonas sp. KU-00592-HH]|uniref:hypothetical protein n=1 Tax=Pelagimonas sp. KU-00592-HH TaxID=3127651 RepID=UPI003108D90A